MMRSGGVNLPAATARSSSPGSNPAMAAAFLQPQRPLQVKQGSWNYLDPGTRRLCEHSVQGLTCNRSHRAGKPRRRKTALRARRRPAFQSEGPGLRPRHGRRWKKTRQQQQGMGRFQRVHSFGLSPAPSSGYCRCFVHRSSLLNTLCRDTGGFDPICIPLPSRCDFRG